MYKIIAVLQRGDVIRYNYYYNNNSIYNYITLFKKYTNSLDYL